MFHIVVCSQIERQHLRGGMRVQQPVKGAVPGVEAHLSNVQSGEGVQGRQRNETVRGAGTTEREGEAEGAEGGGDGGGTMRARGEGREKP